MANINRGEVEITIAGQDFTARFTNNVLAELERAEDKDLDEIAEIIAAGRVRFSIVQSAIALAVAEKNPSIKPALTKARFNECTEDERNTLVRAAYGGILFATRALTPEQFKRLLAGEDIDPDPEPEGDEGEAEASPEPA